MKHKTLLILSSCMLALIGFAAATATLAADQEQDKQQIMKLERAWCAAAVKGDATTVGAILSEDYTEVSVTGELADKAQTLADIKAVKTTACAIETMQVRIYGDSAVVVGRVSSQSAAGPLQFRYTDIYIRRANRWLCVAAQNSAIKA